MAAAEFIHASEGDGASVITIDRPDKLNALTLPMLRAIAEAIADAPTVDGLVLTGEGRAFSAGDDLAATEDLDSDTFTELLGAFQAITLAILRKDMPVVAALNGIAVGGAAEMVLACDARVGWSGSDLLFPENNIGLTISNGSSYLLPRLLGPRALPIVLDGRRISGPEAHSFGLIDYFVESQNEVVPEALRVLRRWKSHGLATRFHLKLLRPRIADVERAIERENALGRRAWDKGTGRAGIARFIKKRTAQREARGS